MKTLFLTVIVAVLASISAFTQTAGIAQPASAPKAVPAKSDAAFKTEEQKTLYALGSALGQQMKQAVAAFSLTATENKFVMMGIRDAFLGEKPKVEMQTYGPKIRELGQARAKLQADKEKEKSKSFLAKMAKEPGAQVAPSGLIYFEVKAGTGASPSGTDTVRAHYKGTFVDGTVFDASAKHGDQPLEFPLGGVIPCWTEGIQKMKVGGKAKLVCPSDIGYGDRGQGSVIPGGATLVFEVELAGVVKKEQPKEDKDFLDKAAKEPGVKKFSSGLIYKEIKAGTGASPQPGDTIKAHYNGTLTDGTVFDSSLQSGQPLEVSLAGVIKCWQEGITKMKVGGKAKLVCPAAIAYGDRGSGKIPPGATILFDVELLDIVKK